MYKWWFMKKTNFIKISIFASLLLLIVTNGFAQDNNSSQNNKESINISSNEGPKESNRESTEIKIPKREDKQKKDSDSDINLVSEDEYYENELEEEKEKTTTKKKKKKKNPFEGFFTPKQKEYHFYETIPLSTGTIGFGIKPKEAEIFLIPGTSKIGIQVYYQTSYFGIIIDEKDAVFIEEAFSRYVDDFDQKKLIRKKNSKTRKMYGSKGKCRVEWGTIRSMMNNYGDTTYQLGYEFKDKSPYFCIIIKDAKNIATDIGSNVSEKSVEIQLYFTKAQARNFLDSIGKERLQKEYMNISETESYYSDEY